MKVSVVIIGDEILIGQVTDTNSGWISRHLNPEGFNVVSVTTTGDNRNDILAAIKSALDRSNLVITTGGLGPTKDDITKSVLTEIFGGKIVHDASVEANVREVVGRRHIKLNDLTLAQADIPTSCQVIQNRVGTAPIMWFEKGGKVLIAMPGVPFETETMMQEAVIPRIIERFRRDEYIMHRTFIVVGYTESDLAIKLERFETSLPEGIKLAYLPRPGIIRLRLTGIGQNDTELSSTLNSLSSNLTKILGENIISFTDIPLEAIIGVKLKEKGLTMATAESCTGGNIAKMITSVAGSSEYFNGGIVAYSNSVKMNILGVSETSLKAYGAVSEEVVKEMSKGALITTGSDCAIATSGIAGPGGGTKEKPVGTVWIAARCRKKLSTRLFHFPGNRDRVVDRASMEALKMLLEIL